MENLCPEGRFLDECEVTLDNVNILGPDLWTNLTQSQGYALEYLTNEILI